MRFRDWLEDKERLGIIVGVDDAYEQKCLDRLRQVIVEYEDLAGIEDWKLVRRDKAITGRLARAYEIMHELKIPEGLRCEPCEMEALCAIREIVGEKHVNFGMQAWGPKGNKDEIKERIRKQFGSVSV